MFNIVPSIINVLHAVSRICIILPNVVFFVTVVFFLELQGSRDHFIPKGRWDAMFHLTCWNENQPFHPRDVHL